MYEFPGSSRLMTVNESLLISDIYSKKSKLLLIYTPETSLDKDKSNSSSFSETIADKLCTEFKIKESMEKVCLEWKESFSSITEIWMSYFGSAIWEYEISYIS